MKIDRSTGRVRASPGLRERNKPAPALRLTVQNATASRAVPTPRAFRRWIRAALRADATVTVRLVGLREGRALNRNYRRLDHATNVLTFVLRDAPPYAGDLALCAPVVVREARAQRKALAAHYAHLTVHGILHLQGYTHDRESDAAAMERLETRILKRLGYPDPYATATHHG